MKYLKYTILLGILFSLLSFVSCSAEELKEKTQDISKEVPKEDEPEKDKIEAKNEPNNKTENEGEYPTQCTDVNKLKKAILTEKVNKLIGQCKNTESKEVFSEKAHKVIEGKLKKIRNIYKKYYERSSCVKDSDCIALGTLPGVGDFCDDGRSDWKALVDNGRSYCSSYLPLSKSLFIEYQKEVAPVIGQCRMIANDCRSILQLQEVPSPSLSLCASPPCSMCVKNKCTLKFSDMKNCNSKTTFHLYGIKENKI